VYFSSLIILLLLLPPGESKLSNYDVRLICEHNAAQAITYRCCFVATGSTLATSYDVMKSRGDVTSVTPQSRDASSCVKQHPGSRSVFERRDIADNVVTWSTGCQSTSPMTRCWDSVTSWMTSPYRYYY